MDIKNKIKVNPIVKKDLRVISRSMKYSWGLFAYVAVLGIVFIFTMLVIGGINSYQSYYKNTDIYEGYVAFFPVIGVAQLCIISLIVPIFTASSISGERERQTMDVMLTTTIPPYSIIIGKIASAVLRVMMFVIASVPLMAVSFVMGGIGWATLFEYLILAFVYAIYAGSIGTFCSAVFKKSIPAIIVSYIIYGAIYGLTYAPALVVSIVSDIDDFFVVFIFTLINPVHEFLIFFYQKISGENLMEYMISYSNYPDFINWIFKSNVWIVTSCIFQLGLAAFFIWLATLKIRPGKK
ncbi:ABC-2 family transporter protein [Lachnospiraceae bacterium NE2001]|nr:ABC-2 family transporter protein [Lachnospiraceae bacterium NE2001]